MAAGASCVTFLETGRGWRGDPESHLEYPSIGERIADLRENWRCESIGASVARDNIRAAYGEKLEY